MKKLTDSTGENSTEAVSSRRDFLKKAGKFAVYTPPAVMMLMKPSFASKYSGQEGSWMGRPDYPGNGKPTQRPGKSEHSWKPAGGSWQAKSRHSWKPRAR